MINYSFFKCEFLHRNEIREKADQFRENYWKKDVLPIDMERVIYEGLNMDIEPRHGVSRLIKIDAYLKSDLTGIVVDYDQYMDDKNRYERRLRFSFAHEIGHYVLHKYIYNKFEIESPKEYYDFIINIPDYEYRAFEFQANEFAGRLLVPRERLIAELNQVCDEAKGYGDQGLIQADKELFIERTAPRLCRPFGVSEDVIVRRVREETLFEYLK